ncbi:MAG: MaoC family dehydratase [Flavobacteriales bacterium]|nr:MaoC family dehydratase [Flavobacteriales bacterium]
MEIGQKASLTKAFTHDDIMSYAQVSLDNNPIHVDEEFAKTTRFGTRIVQGILVTGLISAVIATKLPGAGAIYLNQTVSFRYPVYINDVITATVEVISIDGAKIGLSTTCFNQDGKVVIEGSALVLVK